MHSRKVKIITVLSAVTCLIWMIGLGWTIKDYVFGTKTASALPALTDESADSSAPFTIIALGDSLTRGTGDIEGKGYVGYVRDRMLETDPDVSVFNLGIKGITSTGLVEQMQQKEIGRQIGQADLILMTIGGNDLFIGGQTLSNPSEESIDKLEAAYLTNLRTVMRSIRSVNPEATLYLLGLYDPFSELSSGALTSKIVREWNAKTVEVMAEYPNAVFVPIYDLFQRNVSEYLFTDQFHPNEKGYRLMAERVAALIAG